MSPAARPRHSDLCAAHIGNGKLVTRRRDCTVAWVDAARRDVLEELEAVALRHTRIRPEPDNGHSPFVLAESGMRRVEHTLVGWRAGDPGVVLEHRLWKRYELQRPCLGVEVQQLCSVVEAPDEEREWSHGMSRVS